MIRHVGTGEVVRWAARVGALIGAGVLILVGAREGRAQVASPATPPVAPPADARVVASGRGVVYYPVECEAWHRLSPAGLRFFGSEEGAREAGYRRTTNRQCLPSLGPESLLPVPPGWDLEGSAPAGICVVARIVDGDTLDCTEGPRIRLLLIDAPEEDGGGPSLQATLALEELLPVGDTAVVSLDVQPRGRYGRLLAHLHDRAGGWVNRALVRRGYAVPLVYPPNVAGVEAIRAASDSARAEGRGLWRIGGFDCLPVDVRAGRCAGDG